MKKVSLILWDLDGTLIDSQRDIAFSVNETMQALGIKPLPEELIASFVGNGVTPLIQKTIETAGGASFDDALRIFKQSYHRHLLDTTRLYPGINETLSHFQSLKKPMAVVTNKSQEFTDKIIAGLDLSGFFDAVLGGDTQFPKKPDPAVVRHLLRQFQISAQETVIIGDSRIDIETGKNAGILTCGVTYGLRPRSELEEAGCDHLVESPRQLMDLFI